MLFNHRMNKQEEEYSSIGIDNCWNSSLHVLELSLKCLKFISGLMNGM